MAADPEHDAFVDDDDMPPLVENPYPASMTFTFAANMTPIAYGTDQNPLELAPAAPGAEYTPMQDEDAGGRGSHSKKKDAGYIPRPPNAFILFRSSFIRAQHIPEKIEGNHSALSKIIGKYWKSLPRQEREVWEAKAIVALAEHRKKYPDWRFRPAANALAKVKDGPKRRSNKKGRGEAEKEKKGRNKERRCDKIAEMLAAGKTGAALAQAIQKYDCEATTATDAAEGMKVEEQGCGVFVMNVQEHYQAAPATQALHTGSTFNPPANPTASPAPAQAQAASPQCRAQQQQEHVSPQLLRDDPRAASPPSPSPSDARFSMPLTSMFRRSASAPAPRDRVPTKENECSNAPYLAYGGCAGFPSGDAPRTGSAPPTCVLGHEAGTRVANGLGVQNVAATSPSSPWSHVLTTNVVGDVGAYSPSLPAFDPDVDDTASPVQSPVSAAFDMFSEADLSSVSRERAFDFASDGGSSPRLSPYSSLRGWAGEPHKTNVSPMKGMVGGGPLVVTPQTAAFYDPESVMQDAFEAAAYAYGAPSVPAYQWAGEYECLEHYAQGLQDVGLCRLGDGGQLSQYASRAAY